MSVNPYAPTVDTVAADPYDGVRIGGFPPASQNKRFGNFIIDNIVLQLLSFVVGFMLALAYLGANGGQVTPAQDEFMQLVSMGVGVFVSLLYFMIPEALFAVTLGKLITGTRVVNVSEAKASLGQILGRTFARMIPFEPLSFLFGDKTTGWHDTLSGTRVVDIRAVGN